MRGAMPRARRTQAMDASSRLGAVEWVETSATQLRLQAICDAVGPYAWRAFTAEMVARRVLGATDRLLVLEMIGASHDGSADLAGAEPVDRGDDRVEPLVQLMVSF